MKKLNWIKILKLLVGTIAATCIALLLSLQYAYAAGIITLLTIQDTKRETVFIALKRLVIFCAMTLLSVLIFPLLGYHLPAFGLLLVPYLLLCFALDMKEAVAPIAVLCTHYVSSQSCSPEMILNEFLILFVGAGIGILLNLFLQSNVKLMRQKQFLIEERMKKMLARMAFYIQEEDRSKYTDECFSQLETLLQELGAESRSYINNHFLGKNDYYYAYMNLRLTQCNLLKRIYTDITRIDFIPAQAKVISDFFIKISNEFHETNNALSLLEDIHQLNLYFDSEYLPASRAEFENRALLYHILKDLEEFVVLKREFYQSNTPPNQK